MAEMKQYKYKIHPGVKDLWVANQAGIFSSNLSVRLRGVSTQARLNTKTLNAIQGAYIALIEELRTEVGSVEKLKSLVEQEEIRAKGKKEIAGNSSQIAA